MVERSHRQDSEHGVGSRHDGSDAAHGAVAAGGHEHSATFGNRAARLAEQLFAALKHSHLGLNSLQRQ